MGKLCLLTLVYLGLLGILIYYGMWTWLIIVILIGGVIYFLLFFAILLELGFRSKYPLDFLAHTRWVNKYFEDKGFELVKHNTYNTDFPESIYRRNEVNVIVKLNAPITEHKPLTITVIASGKQKKVWTFPANKDEKVFESFELFLQSNYNILSALLTFCFYMSLKVETNNNNNLKFDLWRLYFS